MADILLSEKVFCHTVRYYHKYFKGIKGDLHAKLKFTPAKLNAWLKSKVKECLMLSLDEYKEMHQTDNSFVGVMIEIEVVLVSTVDAENQKDQDKLSSPWANLYVMCCKVNQLVKSITTTLTPLCT